jgi:hypothetical protein
VLFGGALLAGAGGVFGAFLVIVGVLFAAGLFAVQVLLTVLLALLIVAGPPLIALSAIPELSHLARTWAHALMAITLVPLGWTVLFATAGALCLDATSFTGGAGGVPGHIAAAFAGLITFAIAVKLPLMLLGELRHLFGSALSGGGGGGGSSGQSTMPGAERVKAAHARLRGAAFEGVPSLGRSAGRAAGALGAPAGGPLGAARRGLSGAARRSGVLPGAAAGVAGGAVAGKAAGRGLAQSGRRGIRERLRNAGAIIASAPSDARAAMAGARKAGRTPRAAAAARAAGRGPRGTGAGTSTGKTPASVAGGAARGRSSSQGPPAPRQRAQGPVRAPSPRTQTPVGRSPTPNAPGGTHPGRKVTTSAQREASGGRRSPNAPTPPPPPVRAQRPAKRKPRPRSGS